MPQWITRTWNWLRAQPRTTRIVIAVGVPTGFALIGLGLWLDTIDWWTGHDYLLNLVSGLTGACFGVPFALVGLDYLNRNQTEFRESEKARVRIAAEVDTFVTSLLDLFNGRDLDDVAARVDDLSVQIDGVRRFENGEPERDEAAADFLIAFNELVPPMPGRQRARFSSFMQYSDEMGRVRVWATGVTTQWHRLSDMAHGQMSGVWIDKTIENAGHQAAKYLFMEGRNPWRHRKDLNNSGPTVMRHFLADVKALCEAAKAMKTHTALTESQAAD
ncbi:hypothetical protein [Streptomyces sp. NPDC051554]|uniref:hypothetical protein n=1 Tax=Streptomyces sp. NPDC051554 TaxID=3365656 RepID=UPI0037A66E92